MTDKISGYVELFNARRRGEKPDAAVLLTDSEVIEAQWRELTLDSVLWTVIDRVPPPCNVLRIRNESPHNLIAIRGLHVLALLTGKRSLPWVELVHQAKPAALEIRTGSACYELARAMSRSFLESLLEEPACA